MKTEEKPKERNGRRERRKKKESERDIGSKKAVVNFIKILRAAFLRKSY